MRGPVAVADALHSLGCVRDILWLAMKLPRLIKDKTGKTLRTSEDAKRYVIAKLKARPGYQSWKHAAELLVYGERPETITTQLEYALLLDGQLDLTFANDQRPK